MFVVIESWQGGIGSGYKKYIAEKEVDDDTYNENGLALFRIQGSGPENMQAIQVDPVCVIFRILRSFETFMAFNILSIYFNRLLHHWTPHTATYYIMILLSLLGLGI